MKKIVLISLLTIFGIKIYGQNKITPDGYNILYYSNGKKSSEGTMKNGKPDGYWITYYENGMIKSEGNRKNYELDSIWKFYNSAGKKTMEIAYKQGKKNGIRKTFDENETIEENFTEDIKQGYTFYYFPEGMIKQKIYFKDGLEDGTSFEYDKKGILNTLTVYKKGFVVSKDNINRFDYNGLKRGLWKEFYENGMVKNECTYLDGKKNGFMKEYSKEGNLSKIEKYINDEKQLDAPELKNYELKYDYYPNGKVKVAGSYYNNKAEGIRREYSQDGKIEKSYVLKDGKVTGMGIIDENGWKQGKWKEYYDDGSLKQEGVYLNTRKTGEWKFYYPGAGTLLEQTGTYDKNGKPEGEWKWFYESGNIRRIENYNEGIENGIIEEKTDSGMVVIKGNYVDGQEDGLWKYQIEGYREEGKYEDGKRTGNWKHYYPNGNLSFEGNFDDGQPNGVHKYFWENGNIKMIGNFIMGLKDGDWNRYNSDESLMITTFYKNGREISYDGVRLTPKLEDE